MTVNSRLLQNYFSCAKIKYIYVAYKHIVSHFTDILDSILNLLNEKKILFPNCFFLNLDFLLFNYISAKIYIS